MTTLATDRLASLIAARRQVLAVLVELARRQLRLVADGQLPSLLSLLATKQSVLRQLETLHRELAPFHADDPDARQWRSPQARAECQRQAQECQALMAQVLELERQAEAALAAQQTATAEALGRLTSLADAQAAYAAAAQPLPHPWPMEG
jgi:flagellar biosynthesis/type III secretory pathway chaperone